MSKKLALIDADTILYQSAAVIQEAPITVTHKLSKRQKEFKNITAFREFLKTDKGRGYSEDDFNWSATPRLTEDVSHALRLIKLSVEKITTQPWVNDFKLFIGGEGNFRKDVATLLPYKGNRPPKPLAFQDCYDYMLKKYKDRVVVCHGREAEDGLVCQAYPAYLRARKTRNKEDMDVVIAAIDKDLRANCPGWHYNYHKPEEGVVWLTDTEVARNFWYQMLIGDRGTDNIGGLTILAPSVCEQYKLSRTKGGCGPVSANKILDGATNEKEMATRVVTAYKAGYGDSWEKHFNENGILLRMQRFEGEMFDAVQYVKSLGVEA